jgi:glutathione S-transferase
MPPRLIIGNKNYSSWSLRPWLAMTVAGIPFDETVISLDAPDFKTRLLAVSPAGKVPVLIDGDTHVWESLAIIDYLAELNPKAGLWPDDRAARALARSVANEMHAGFLPLRRACPMNFWLPPKPRPIPDDAMANVRRIDAIWSDCRRRFGGPFLFGAHFGAADAMYAPVVARFFNYGVAVSPSAETYMQAVMATPAWTAWRSAALKETWVMPNNEPDWPVMERMSA